MDTSHNGRRKPTTVDHLKPSWNLENQSHLIVSYTFISLFICLRLGSPGALAGFKLAVLSKMLAGRDHSAGAVLSSYTPAFSELSFLMIFILCVFLCESPSVCMCTFCGVPVEARRGIGSPWNWNYGCELLCGCWEPNTSHLGEQPLL